MHRLAIVDPAHGHQPVAAEDGRVVAIQNRLYNHEAVRAELRRAGHAFRTDCDTEILTHVYEEYGPAFPEKLREQVRNRDLGQAAAPAGVVKRATGSGSSPSTTRTPTTCSSSAPA